MVDSAISPMLKKEEVWGEYTNQVELVTDGSQGCIATISLCQWGFLIYV